MYTVISPAKKLNFEKLNRKIKITNSNFKPETNKLLKTVKKLSSRELQSLMKISTSLADLNYERFKSFRTTNSTNEKQAILAFAGDVYSGLDAISLTNNELEFSQKHIGILSGLYGLLRPLDGIQPYRLEMGSKLSIDSSSNLYNYWEDKLTNSIINMVSNTKSNSLVNLASNEYFSAIQTKGFPAPIIQPIFKETVNGQNKIISFVAKKSRGLMARYIIKNKINDPKHLKEFDIDDYKFRPKLSDETRWVFTRIHSKK